MKFTNKELADLFSASYNPKLFNIDRFTIVPQLSDTYVKTYSVSDSTDVVVVHRGSHDSKDWVDNALHLASVNLRYTKTYKMHLDRQMKVVKKYGKDNIVCLGHSRGGLYSEDFYRLKLCKQSIVYNKPVIRNDIIRNIFEKPDKNNQSIRTSGDIISIGQTLLNRDQDITIPSKGYNIIENHKPDRLNDLEDDTLIGTGKVRLGSDLFSILKANIDYSKIRKDELKMILRPYKKEYNIRYTNITKPELIDYVKIII